MSTARTQNPCIRRVAAYFRSGWAFLIPYLATYLIYYWRKWPANPVGIQSSHAAKGSPWAVEHAFFPIPLLHIYWFLHAVNAGLFLAWCGLLWNENKCANGNRETRKTGEHVITGIKSSRPSECDQAMIRPRDEGICDSAPRSAWTSLLPWILLALIFFVPGVYLEWPSDPWEHLRRIVEWASLDNVGFHSAGLKTQYFLAYSIVGRCSPERLLFWLDCYYTGVCLLLSWQYYRLGRVVGLDSRWAFLFVVVNFLTFGNVSFSFYRYYGLATTMYMQVGIVALFRVCLTAALHGVKNTSLASRMSAEEGALVDGRGLKSRPQWLLGSLVSMLLLLFLIAFSHVEGLGIAALGVGAICAWRLIEWKRSIILYIAAGGFALSVAAVLWFPRHPLLDLEYRRDGWLNAWYAFNICSWPSPAADRAMQILGVFGAINLAAGVGLICRNSCVGWLTVGPVFGLCMPFVSIPIAEVFAVRGEPILTFHRLLFAIPSGLALTSIGVAAADRLRKLKNRMVGEVGSSVGIKYLVFATVLLLALCFVLLPSSGFSFNRLWNAVSIQADDLRLLSVGKELSGGYIQRQGRVDRVVAAPGFGFVLGIKGSDKVVLADNRTIVSNSAPSTRADIVVGEVEKEGEGGKSTLVVVPQWTSLTSSISLAAVLSKHWYPSEVALQYVGGSEIESAAIQLGYTSTFANSDRLFYYRPTPSLLKLPLNLATGVRADTVFVWSKTPNAQGYYLYVGTRAGEKDVINTGELSPSVTSHEAIGLPFNKTLYATIFTKLAGIWYPSSSTFTVEPPVATLRSIANGQIKVPINGDVEWDSAPNAEAYRLEIGRNPGASDVFDTGPIHETARLLSGLPAGEKLYATLMTKVAGSWYSSARMFTTMPEIAALVKPADRSTSVASDTEFIWSKAPIAQGYYLYVGTSVGTKDVVNTGILPPSVFSHKAQGLPAGRTLFATMFTEVDETWYSSSTVFATESLPKGK